MSRFVQAPLQSYMFESLLSLFVCVCVYVCIYIYIYGKFYSLRIVVLIYIIYIDIVSPCTSVWEVLFFKNRSFIYIYIYIYYLCMCVCVCVCFLLSQM